MNSTNFSFAPWKSELIYDNHGCPTCTEYSTDFTFKGIPFTAEFNDVARFIRLYHGCNYISGISGLKSASTAKAEEFIERAFEADDDIKNFLTQHVKNIVEKIKPFDLGYEWS